MQQFVLLQYVEMACLRRILGQIFLAGILTSYPNHAYVLPSLTVATLLCKAAIADWCGAVQLSPSSSAAMEVVPRGAPVV